MSLLQLSGLKGDTQRNPVIAFNHPDTNLPTTYAYQYGDSDTPKTVLCNYVSTVHQENTNLSEAQKELLRWHQRLGHLALKKIQHLMRTGVLSHTESIRKLHAAASKLTSPPNVLHAYLESKLCAQLLARHHQLSKTDQEF